MPLLCYEFANVTCSYLNLDFVNNKAYINFDQSLSICFKHIERKLNVDINQEL